MAGGSGLPTNIIGSSITSDGITATLKFKDNSSSPVISAYFDNQDEQSFTKISGSDFANYFSLTIDVDGHDSTNMNSWYYLVGIKYYIASTLVMEKTNNRVYELAENGEVNGELKTLTTGGVSNNYFYGNKTSGYKNVKIVLTLSANSSGTNTFTRTYTWQGALNVKELAVDTISLGTGSVQKQFLKYETFNSDNLVVNANYKYYNNVVAGSKAVSSFSVSKPDTTTVGTKTVTVTYLSKTATYNIEVVNEYSTANSMTTNLDTILDYEHFYPVINYDISGLTATLVYSNGSETLARSNLDVYVDNVMVTGNSISFNSAGNHTIKVDGTATNSVTKTIAVESPYVTSYSLSYNNFQTTYIDGQTISKSGLTVTQNFNNGTSSVLSENDYSLVDVNGNTLGTLTGADNGKTVYVKPNNGEKQSTGKTLTIQPRVISGVEVTRDPTKTTYCVGQSLQLDGLVIVLSYNDGTTKELSTAVGYADPDITITPAFDDVYTDTGTETYTVTSNSHTDTFEVTVVAPIIRSATASGQQLEFTKNTISGTTFSSSGIVVNVTTTDNYQYVADSEDIIVTPKFNANFKENASDDNSNWLPYSSESNVYLVEVSVYNHWDNSVTPYKFNYQITFSPNETIKSAYLDPSVNGKKYVVGDVYNAEDVVFHVTTESGEIYDDNNNFYSPNYPIGEAVFRSGGNKTIQLVYENGGKVFTGEYEVSVSVPYTNQNLNTVKLVPSIETDTITHAEASIMCGISEGKLALFPQNKVSNGIYIGQNKNKDCVGYLVIGSQVGDEIIEKGHVVFFEDPTNPIEGDGNIVVKFPHYEAGFADKVNKCKFGIVYNNRLFVSGNPDFKNCDWHTGDVNVNNINSDTYAGDTLRDYSYFSDLDYCFYGNDETAVVGYDIFRDGDLIVVKEGSRNQATLYKRTFKLTSAMSYDGSFIDNQVEELFPMYDINSNGGEGGLSNGGIVNYLGDTLVLTNTGLKSITTNEEIKNDAKYSKDVSTRINPKIKDEGLKTSFLYTFNNHLLLKTDRGVYVAYEELRSDYEYEWYFIDNIDADIFFEIDGELYFANGDGMVCKFCDKYRDINRIFIAEGGVAPVDISPSNDTIVVSGEYAEHIVKGNQFHLRAVNGQIHANIGRIKNVLAPDEANTEYIGEFNHDTDIIYSDDERLYDGRTVYLDAITGGVYSVAVDEPYTLKKENVGVSNAYSLENERGEKVSLKGVDYMRLSFTVGADQDTIINNVTNTAGGGKQIELIGDHDEPLDLFLYEGESSVYSGVISESTPVKAFYMTIPYSFGSLSHSKTIWSWTFANDTNIASYTDVGYLSSTNQGKSNFDWAIKSASGSRTFEFGKFTTHKVQFNNDLLPHIYVRYRTIPTINFIRFVFSNEYDSNMVLSELEIIYSISQFTRGSK